MENKVCTRRVCGRNIFTTKLTLRDNKVVGGHLTTNTPYRMDSCFLSPLKGFAFFVCEDEDGKSTSLVRFLRGFPCLVERQGFVCHVLWEENNTKVSFVHNDTIPLVYTNVEITEEKREYSYSAGIFLGENDEESFVLFPGKFFPRVYATDKDGERVRLHIPIFRECS